MIFITGMIDSVDYLSAFSLDGKMLWQVPYGKSWIGSYPDTRSSPTIEGDRVYVLSGNGVLSCFNSKSGSKIWTVDVDRDYKSERHVWGVSESPLIVDDKVICSPGGQMTSIIALNKLTGELIWKSESLGAQRSYVSPVIYNYKNFRYILAATAQHLVALLPENGNIVWTFNYFNVQEWKSQPGLIWANSPIYKDDEIYISKGYNHPSVMLKMNSEGTEIAQKFANTTLDNHHHGVIVVDGYIYGANWQSNSKGKWVCMNWETGDIMFEEEWVSKGSMVYADGMLYGYVERDGSVGLIKPNPEKFDLVSTFRVRKGSGPHWAHPYIKDGVMYLRHGEYMVAYNIKAE
jgi:outer membrane protein assembly factor BamB